MTAEVNPALLAGAVASVLVTYYSVLLGFRRRIASTSLVLSLGALPLFTIVGALPILIAEQRGGTATYLELELFDVESNSAYSIALAAYSLFLFIVLGIVLGAPTSRWRQLEHSHDSSWAAIWSRFNHASCLAIILILELTQLATIRTVAVDGSAYGLIVEDSTSGRVYTYAVMGATYLIALGAVGLAASQTPAGKIRKAFLYAILACGQVSLSLTSGQRRYVLIALVAFVCGLVSRSGPSRRVANAVRVSIFLVLGIIGLGLIGLVRGRRPDVDLVTTLFAPEAIFESVAQTVEIYAAHMSLYGVLHASTDIPFVLPFAQGAYGPYINVVGASSLTQGFTIHPVAGWWFTVGSLAPLAAAVMVAGAMLAFRRLAVARPTYWSRGYLVAASVLPAAGIPLILLRGDSSSWRGLVLELLVIPGTLMQICFLLSSDGSLRRRTTGGVRTRRDSRNPAASQARRVPTHIGTRQVQNDPTPSSRVVSHSGPRQRS